MSLHFQLKLLFVHLTYENRLFLKEDNKLYCLFKPKAAAFLNVSHSHIFLSASFSERQKILPSLLSEELYSSLLTLVHMTHCLFSQNSHSHHCLRKLETEANNGPGCPLDQMTVYTISSWQGHRLHGMYAEYQKYNASLQERIITVSVWTIHIVCNNIVKDD